MNFDQRQQPLHAPHGVHHRHTETSFASHKNKYHVSPHQVHFLLEQTSWDVPNQVSNQNRHLVLSVFHRLGKLDMGDHFRVLRAANLGCNVFRKVQVYGYEPMFRRGESR